MSSESFSLDTSFVLRLMVSQPLYQFRVAARFLREQRASDRALFVSDLVLAEAYFALQSHYQVSKTDALAILTSFAQDSGVTVSPIARDVLALPGLATANPGLVDRLIHGLSHSAGQTLVSFEQAAGKLPATLVLAATP